MAQLLAAELVLLLARQSLLTKMTIVLAINAIDGTAITIHTGILTLITNLHTIMHSHASRLATCRLTVYAASGTLVDLRATSPHPETAVLSDIVCRQAHGLFEDNAAAGGIE